MVGAWPHPPGTLRALITILRSCHIICRPCRRYASLSAERRDLDRPAHPCPFVCSRCGVRAEIVLDVPADFALSEAAPRPRKPAAPEPPPAEANHGPRYKPRF